MFWERVKKSNIIEDPLLSFNRCDSSSAHFSDSTADYIFLPGKW